MIYFHDLLQNDGFRSFVQKRIASRPGNEGYAFPSSFPPLYRYRSLSEYAINDIVQDQFTLTSIGEFNDLFDGAFHMAYTQKECKRQAADEWNERKKIFDKLPIQLVDQHDQYIAMRARRLKEDAWLKFRELDYLGTYVGCLSSQCDSTLMWSHYADYNRGICVEYDFNQFPQDHLLRKAIFPVYYSENPIDLMDLIADEKHEVYEYPLDAAVLCTALNKAVPWRYEQEWRLVLVLVSLDKKTKWVPMPLAIRPTSICLGYHFLKVFFSHPTKSIEESAKEKEKIKLDLQRFYQLLDYVNTHQIRLSLMIPVIGSYQLAPRPLSVQSLQRFMRKQFDGNYIESIHLYYTVHDALIELVEKEQDHV